MNNRKWQHIRRSAAAVLAVALAAGSAGAAEDLGTLTWDASNNAGEASGQWTSIIDSGTWVIGNDANTPTRTSADPTRLAGIASAYSFDGNDDGVSQNNTSMFTSRSPNPNNDPASFEIWFKPTSLTGGDQVLFETGGTTTGSSLTISDGQIRWRAKYQSTGLITITADLPTTGEFIQVVGAITPGGDGNDSASLFINGSLATPTFDNLLGFNTANPGPGANDDSGVQQWDGSNVSGLGNNGSALGGDLSGFGGFDGQIAIMRWHEQDLNATQVQTNYDAVAAPEYATAVLDADPITYWRLGERAEAVNSATTSDAAGNSYSGLSAAGDGTFSGNPSVISHGLLGTDPNNTSVYFDGVDDRLNINSNGAINTSGPYTAKTFEMIFRADDVDAGNSLDPQVLYEQGGASNGFNLFIDDGELHAGIWVNSNFFEAVDAIMADTAYHVASVWDGDVLMLYINGELVDTADPTFSSVPSHTGGILIGASNGTRISNTVGDDNGPKYFYGGLLDEIALYNTSLDGSTILTHFEATGIPAPAALPAGLTLLSMLGLRRRHR
ncbi:LamG domain-containing protein [Planctomycetales bacterium ZRK34]|nr:LamG domain-containing protein [Planctomycetales bacterium ZRK34]